VVAKAAVPGFAGAAAVSLVLAYLFLRNLDRADTG
jgi:hypothetical protein